MLRAFIPFTLVLVLVLSALSCSSEPGVSGVWVFELEDYFRLELVLTDTDGNVAGTAETRIDDELLDQLDPKVFDQFVEIIEAVNIGRDGKRVEGVAVDGRIELKELRPGQMSAFASGSYSGDEMEIVFEGSGERSFTLRRR